MYQRILIGVTLLVAIQTAVSAAADPAIEAIRALNSNLAASLEAARGANAPELDRTLALKLARYSVEQGLDHRSATEIILAAAKQGQQLRLLGHSPLMVRQHLFLQASRIIRDSKNLTPDRRVPHIRQRMGIRRRDSRDNGETQRTALKEKRRDEKRYAGTRGGAKDKKKADNGSGNHGQ